MGENDCLISDAFAMVLQPFAPVPSSTINRFPIVRFTSRVVQRKKGTKRPTSRGAQRYANRTGSPERGPGAGAGADRGPGVSRVIRVFFTPDVQTFGLQNTF